VVLRVVQDSLALDAVEILLAHSVLELHRVVVARVDEREHVVENLAVRKVPVAALARPILADVNLARALDRDFPGRYARGNGQSLAAGVAEVTRHDYLLCSVFAADRKNNTPIPQDVK